MLQKGDGETCKFTAESTSLGWVSRGDKAADADEELHCTRDPVEGHDRCLFHLPPEERPNDLPDPSTRLRERLEELAAGKPPVDEYISYRGCWFDEIDISELDLGVLSGRDATLDFSFSRVTGSVNLSNAVVPGPIDFSFSHLGSLSIDGAETELQALICNNAHIAGDASTESHGRDSAVDINRDPSIRTLSLVESRIKGEVDVDEITVGNRIDGRLLEAERLRLDDVDTPKLDLTRATIDDHCHIDGPQGVGSIKAGRLSAGTVLCQGGTVENAVTFDNIDADRFSMRSISLGSLSLEPPGASEITLDDVSLDAELAMAVGSDERHRVDEITLRRCTVGGTLDMSRVEPGKFLAKNSALQGEVIAKKFECQEARFTATDGVLFEGDIDFTDATLPEVEFESDGPTVDGKPQFKQAELTRANLSGFTSTEPANFTEANLTEARMNNADLEGAILEGALLNRARLIGTNLKGAYLYQAALGNTSVDTHTELGFRQPDTSGINILRRFNPRFSDGREYLVYDPRSSYDYDGDPGIDSEVDSQMKAMEAYMSIHNTASESGISELAIDAYIKRQEMKTRQANRVTQAFRWIYGVTAKYGVGTMRLGVVAALMIGFAVLGHFGLGGVSGNPGNVIIYAMSGFVGVTPPIDVTPLDSAIHTVHAMVGAVMIALFANALGRRSTM